MHKPDGLTPRQQTNLAAGRKHSLCLRFLGTEWYDTESQARRVIEYLAEALDLADSLQNELDSKRQAAARRIRLHDQQVTQQAETIRTLTQNRERYAELLCQMIVATGYIDSDNVTDGWRGPDLCSVATDVVPIIKDTREVLERLVGSVHAVEPFNLSKERGPTLADAISETLERGYLFPSGAYGVELTPEHQEAVNSVFENYNEARADGRFEIAESDINGLVSEILVTLNLAEAE